MDGESGDSMSESTDSDKSSCSDDSDRWNQKVCGEVTQEDEDDDENSDEENDQLVNEQPKLDDENLGPNVKLDHKELEDFMKRKKLTGYDIERTEIRTTYQIQKIKAGL